MYERLLGCVLKGSFVTEHAALHVVNLADRGFLNAFKLDENQKSENLFHGCVCLLIKGNGLSFESPRV